MGDVAVFPLGDFGTSRKRRPDEELDADFFGGVDEVHALLDFAFEVVGIYGGIEEIGDLE
jgi:hypothetical protein